MLVIQDASEQSNRNPITGDPCDKSLLPEISGFRIFFQIDDVGFALGLFAFDALLLARPMALEFGVLLADAAQKLQHDPCAANKGNKHQKFRHLFVSFRQSWFADLSSQSQTGP